MMMPESDLAEWCRAMPADAANEIERLRKALAEIVVRTVPYQEDYESWPLVAGVHRVAHDALADSSQ
jgi:hypothetical protein